MIGKFHGIFSLLLIAATVVIALASILSQTIGWGLAYVAVIMLANPIVLYSYCAKCLCREDACGHVFPGRLTRLLPNRKPGSYNFMDYLGTAISLIVLFGFPQFWLWQNVTIFLLFWIMLITALVEILFFVCRTCNNTNCPNCYKKIQTIV
jgi:hypothetical protein